MKIYHVKAVSGSPDWNVIPEAELQHEYAHTPCQVRAYAQLAWGDNTLFVHLRAEVPYIRAEEFGPYGMPCEDSCLEFFFCPVAEDPHYFNIEYNFNGCMYLGYGTGLEDLIRLIPNERAEEIFCPEIRTTETGWEIFYRIPYSFIQQLLPQAQLSAGQTIRGNFYVCSDLSEPAYYRSWNPVSTEPFTFHRSECFGVMEFDNN